MQLLGDALRFERVLAGIERLEHLERGLDQAAVGEDAAEAGDAGVGVDDDQGVNGIVRLDFRRPAALRAFAHQGDGSDRADSNKVQSHSEDLLQKVAEAPPSTIRICPVT